MNTKLLTVAALIGTLMLGLIIGLWNPFNKTEEVEKNNKDYTQMTYLPILKFDDFDQKIADGDTFYVYIGRPDCGDSELFNQQFEELFVEMRDGEAVDVYYELDDAEKKHFYYFDIQEIIDSTSNKEARESYKELYDFYFTPSLVAYEDVDGDGRSEAVNIAQWNAVNGFKPIDFMRWFYETGLIPVNDKIYPLEPTNEG